MLSVFDVILALICVEGGVLSFVYIRTGHGVSPHDALPNLAAGFFLLLTARLGLSGAPAWALSATLFAALLGHAIDLARRWRGNKNQLRGPANRSV